MGYRPWLLDSSWRAHFDPIERKSKRPGFQSIDQLAQARNFCQNSEPLFLMMAQTPDSVYFQATIMEQQDAN